MTRWDVTKAVRASDLPAPSRLIMLVLADVAEVGTAEIPARFTPSLSVLVEETGLDRRTVQRHLVALEASGWVIRFRPDAKAQWLGERVRYRLDLPSGMEPPQVAEDRPGGGTETPEVAAQSHIGGGTEPPLKTDPSDPSLISSDHPPTAKRSKRGTRIPDDFSATAEMIAWARQHTPLAGSRDHEAFVDYWRGKPGQQGVKTDWPATWRNWMRRAQSDRETHTGRNGKPSHQPYRNPTDASAYLGEL